MNTKIINHIQDYIELISNIISSRDEKNSIITYRGECQIYPNPCIPNIYREEYLKNYEFFEKNIFDEHSLF